MSETRFIAALDVAPLAVVRRTVCSPRCPPWTHPVVRGPGQQGRRVGERIDHDKLEMDVGHVSVEAGQLLGSPLFQLRAEVRAPDHADVGVGAGDLAFRWGSLFEKRRPRGVPDDSEPVAKYGVESECTGQVRARIRLIDEVGVVRVSRSLPVRRGENTGTGRGMGRGLFCSTEFRNCGVVVTACNCSQ